MGVAASSVAIRTSTASAAVDGKETVFACSVVVAAGSGVVVGEGMAGLGIAKLAASGFVALAASSDRLTTLFVVTAKLVVFGYVRFAVLRPSEG